MERLLKTCECPTCGETMIFRNNLVKTFHYKGKCLELKGLSGYCCENCGEIIFTPEEFHLIENLVHALSDNTDAGNSHVDVLNLDETADFLRVSNQTIYNMIRDGRIKAHKVGREWRFFRSDLNAYLNSTSSLAMAAKGGTLDKSDLLTIQEELNKRSKHND